MQPHANFEVSLDDDGGVSREPVAVKLQSDAAELNIWLTFSDIDAILRGIPSGQGVRALAAGTAAEAQAFWALEPDGQLSIVVGHDDETWDFGVTLSPGTRDSLLKALQRMHDKVMRSNTSLERTRGG